MTQTANGTDAQEVIRYFVGKTMMKAAGQDFARMIHHAKRLLADGYSKRDIIRVIDYTVDVKRVQVYSFGYVSKTIADTLAFLNAECERDAAREYVEQMEKSMPSIEVKDDGESGERNRNKLARFGSQSRLREKYSFDMFEGRE